MFLFWNAPEVVHCSARPIIAVTVACSCTCSQRKHCSCKVIDANNPHITIDRVIASSHRPTYRSIVPAQVFVHRPWDIFTTPPSIRQKYSRRSCSVWITIFAVESVKHQGIMARVAHVSLSKLLTEGRKCIGVGKNYLAHIQEMSHTTPNAAEVTAIAKKTPVLFMKPTTSYALPGSPLIIPPDIGSVHYELELGIIVGKKFSR